MTFFEDISKPQGSLAICTQRPLARLSSQASFSQAPIFTRLAADALYNSQPNFVMTYT